MELEALMLSEISETKVSYGFTQIWIIRNSTEVHKSGETERKQIREETNHERLLILGNKLRVSRVKLDRRWGIQGMGIKKGT